MAARWRMAAATSGRNTSGRIHSLVIDDRDASRSSYVAIIFLVSNDNKAPPAKITINKMSHPTVVNFIESLKKGFGGIHGLVGNCDRNVSLAAADTMMANASSPTNTTLDCTNVAPPINNNTTSAQVPTIDNSASAKNAANPINANANVDLVMAAMDNVSKAMRDNSNKVCEKK